MQDLPRPLKIAFDAKRLFHNREGLGSYARTLVSSMQELLPQHSYYLCTPTLSDHPYAQDFLDDKKYQHLIAPPKAQKAIWRSRGILKTLRENEIDVYWGLSNELPIGISKLRCKTLVTIHDLFYKKYPQQFSWADRLIVSKKYEAAMKSADTIIVASQNTRNDLVAHFPEVSERVEVVYQGTQYEGRQAALGSETDPYYLIVGSITQRKNIELIVKTYAEMKPEARLQVKIVGRATSHKEILLRQMKEGGVADSFEFLGQVSNQVLWNLYSGARALLFPSHYEGFGIPIIEALAAGVPVIGNASSSIPEIIGKHGIVIEYDSTESLMAAFLKLKDESIRIELLEGVETHLALFSKIKVIKGIERVLNDLVSGNLGRLLT